MRVVALDESVDERAERERRNETYEDAADAQRDHHRETPADRPQQRRHSPPRNSRWMLPFACAPPCGITDAGTFTA